MEKTAKKEFLYHFNLSKINKKKAKKAKQSTVMSGALLSLSACTSGGGGSPTEQKPPPVEEPTTSTFVEVDTDEWEADSDLPGTFNMPASTDDLQVVGMGGDDSITTGSGDDLIAGRDGADTIDGGDGFDILSYATSDAAVTIDLGAGTASGGDADGDIYSNMEGLFGSPHNDTFTGDANTNAIEGGAGADTLDGGGGGNFLSYFTSSSGVNIDLGAGTASGGDAAGDTFSNFNHIIGSDFADVFTGNSSVNSIAAMEGDDEIIGTDGSDILNGGMDSDRINYSNSPSAVTVNLQAGTNGGGFANGDTLSNFENITGSDFNDTLTGDDNVNNIQGGDGNDIIDGGGDGDTLDGGNGTDTLTYSTSPDSGIDFLSGVDVILNDPDPQFSSDAEGDILSNFENLTGSAFDDILIGDSGANVISGLAGDDLIGGEAGADVLDGGTGFDVLSYFTSDAAVTVNLATNTVSGGHAQGDTISNFEDVSGSEFDDTITGDATGNYLYGEGGADTLSGGAGDDYFIVDSDSTTSLADTVAGGTGFDTVIIELADNDTYSFDLSTENLINIERIYLQWDESNIDINLTVADVIAVTEGANFLYIGEQFTESGVTLGTLEVTSLGEGWVQGADNIGGGVTYNSYDSGAVTLFIEENIVQNIS